MPRRYGSVAGKKAILGGASSEAVRAKLDTLLEKVKAPSISSAEGINRLTLNGIGLCRQGVVVQKSTRAWVLAATVLAGCVLGFGGTYASMKKHPVKEEMMQ